MISLESRKEALNALGFPRASCRLLYVWLIQSSLSLIYVTLDPHQQQRPRPNMTRSDTQFHIYIYKTEFPTASCYICGLYNRLSLIYVTLDSHQHHHI